MSQNKEANFYETFEGKEVHVCVNFTYYPSENSTYWDDGAPEEIDITRIVVQGVSYDVEEFDEVFGYHISEKCWDFI